MSLRPYTHLVLVGLFAFALVCSAALKAGHADVPIADSADSIMPLGVGDTAPRFIVATADGAAFDFNPQTLQRPAVILAFRGGWCPYCNVYLSEMRHVIPEIHDLGVDVLFLSGDRPERLYSSLQMQTKSDIEGLNYTLLSDADAQAAIALGIAFKVSDDVLGFLEKRGDDVDESSMQRHGVLPVPAVFAIDRQGVIQFSYTNADYKVRLPADDLKQAAMKIAAAE